MYMYIYIYISSSSITNKCLEDYRYEIFIYRIYEGFYKGVLNVWLLLYMPFRMYIKKTYTE